jgi:DNA-binding winged helix-turn-helix (wHTH) protein/predicted Zn-dependent protease
MQKGKHFYEFGDFRVEPEERIILRSGRPLPLSGKAFDVLVMLLKHHGQLVRKDQLITEVWPDTIVEEGILNVNMSTIRKALGNEYIVTVPKHGYRFVAEVTEGTEAREDGSTVLPKSKHSTWLAFALIILAIGGGLYFAFHRGLREAPSPTGAAALYEQALKYERIGDDEQALAALDQALAMTPQYEAACVRAAFIAYEIDQDQRANDYLVRCKAIDANDEVLRLKAQGLTEVLADNSDRALESYQLLIDRYPQDTDGLYRFAELATDMDRLEEAEKAAQRCLIDEADNPFCRFQLMYVNIKQNKFDDVLSQYHNLPASERDFPWFDEPVGIALFGKGQLDDATRIFGRLAESQKGLHGTVHFKVAKEWLVDLLLYQGRIKDAVRSIDQIMGTSDQRPVRAPHDDSLAGWLAYLAQIYVLTGDDKQAVAFANQTASATPADPSALVQAALVLASLGDSRGVERLLKLRSDATRNSLSLANDHLIRGVLAVAKGDASSGIEEIRWARDLDPRDGEAVYQLAMAYFRAGNYESAAKMFQTVEDLRGIVLLDNSPLLLTLSKYRIVQCYEHLGNPDSARSSYAELAALWSGADEELRRRFLARAP